MANTGVLEINGEKLEIEFPEKSDAVWTDDMKIGYARGYNAAKSKWQSTMKNALKEQASRRVELCSVYPYNVILDVTEKTGELTEYDISIRAVREVFNRVLSEREQRVLEERYSHGKTLEECGKEFGVTRERIRQIECRSLWKIQQHINEMLCVPLAQYLGHEKEEKLDLSDNPIVYLTLSLRAENALRRHGVKTIGQLCECRKSDLRDFRGMGAKSINEIEMRLATCGLKLKDE